MQFVLYTVKYTFDALIHLHFVRYTSRWWSDGRWIPAYYSHHFVTVHL